MRRRLFAREFSGNFQDWIAGEEEIGGFCLPGFFIADSPNPAHSSCFVHQNKGLSGIETPGFSVILLDPVAEDGFTIGKIAEQRVGQLQGFRE